jgi:hypothetical protein
MTVGLTILEVRIGEPQGSSLLLAFAVILFPIDHRLMRQRFGNLCWQATGKLDPSRYRIMLVGDLCQSFSWKGS